MPDMTIISADGTELAARRSGQGSPLVLVHGAMGNIDDFALIEEALAERHSVWVYSRRGRGGSGDGHDYSLQREVEDVLAVVQAAGDSVHLVGHSSGAFYCLLAAPQASSLRSLVLYEPPLHVARVTAAVLDEVESALNAGDPDRALEVFFPIADIVDDEVKAMKAEAAVWEALCEGVRVFPREHRALQADGYALVSGNDPPQVPTLYLYGEKTGSEIFATLDEIIKLLPAAQLHRLDRQRHMAPVFEPTEFAQAVLAFTTAHDR